ncbi:MAG: hypothetical protein CMK44_01080 [Porticoccus sp.]|nr:hypothetical protein [Porticoccus sp.]
MFKIFSLGLYFTNVYSQVVGDTRDDNNCLISAGYSWCESSHECIRSWETPCEDNFISCGDCLKKQRKGMNIACPVRCDVEGPISIPLPPDHCPEVMCMMYCGNGYVQDDNGCNTCRCNEHVRVIDPIPTSMPAPMPSPMPPHILVGDPISDTPVINPFLNTCSEIQMAVYHECNSDCHNCDFKDTRTVLSDCMNNGLRASDDLCHGDIHLCSIPYNDCDNEFVCPKITEVTDCGGNGLSGYSTYRLSLIVKNPDVKNIYAIYGDDEDSPMPMIIPPAYQSIINFNSNIGGVLPAIINIDPDSQYDSWLTIGITDGNTGNQVSTVGIDFSIWTETSGIHTTNGAVFTIDPEVSVVDGDEYTIAQITIPNSRSVELIINAQGKTNCVNNCNSDNLSWKQKGIIFNIVPPTRENHNNIPHSCSAWFDGCNTCQVRNGQIGSCTRVMCFRVDTPYCKVFDTSGH